RVGRCLILNEAPSGNWRGFSFLSVWWSLTYGLAVPMKGGSVNKLMEDSSGNSVLSEALVKK
ncbi:hypothetical protein, partial [Sphingobacterium griseoflavum]